MRYKIVITETVTYQTYVDAESEEHADELAQDLIDTTLDLQDNDDLEFMSSDTDHVVEEWNDEEE